VQNPYATRFSPTKKWVGGHALRIGSDSCSARKGEERTVSVLRRREETRQKKQEENEHRLALK